MRAGEGDNSLLTVSMARLTFPAFGTALLAVSYGLIDSFFLSRISFTAAAAVGGVFSCLAMCIFAMRNFAQAGGIVASQFIGANRSELVAKSFTTSLCICASLGIVFGLAVFSLRDHLGLWLGFSDELNALSGEYLQLAGVIILLQAISFSYLMLIAIYGYTHWTFLVFLLGNIANILCNSLLLLWQNGHYLSVSGVALATCISQLVVLSVSMYLVHSKLRISLTRVPYDELHRLARQTVSIGVPGALFPVSLQMNMMVLIIIITRLGPEMLSTQVYTSNIIMLIIAWSGAVAQSSQIYISRLAGAGNHTAANAQLRQSMLWGVAGVLFCVSLCYLFSDSVYGMLTDNPVILASGASILLMGLVLEPLRAINLILLSSLNATGDAKFPGLLSIAIMWLIGLPLSWLFSLPLEYGLIGIYIGRIIDEAVRATIVYRRWHSGNWKSKAVVLNNNPAPA